MLIDTEARQTILEIVEKIKQEYQPEKIILFGSYAEGRQNEDSDIDLFIIKETEERPIDRRVKVAEIICDPHRFIPVESIVITPQELQQRLKIGDQFIQKILQRGELLYAA